MAQHSYGIDIGTSNFKLFSVTNKKMINEKNIIAIKNKSEIIEDTYEDTYTRFNSKIYVKATQDNNPGWSEGVIADIKNMGTLFECFVQKINGQNNAGDFCIAVPTDVTEVEKRAFYDLIAESRIKSKRINVVEKPIADAVGVGLDVESPKGKLIIDIGADTTEI